MANGPKVTIYRDRSKRWRWRLRSGNNMIISGPQQGYSDRRGALRGYDATMLAMAKAVVVDEAGDPIAAPPALNKQGSPRGPRAAALT